MRSNRPFVRAMPLPSPSTVRAFSHARDEEVAFSTFGSPSVLWDDASGRRPDRQPGRLFWTVRFEPWPRS